jgi:hypothetical protein
MPKVDFDYLNICHNVIPRSLLNKPKDFYFFYILLFSFLFIVCNFYIPLPSTQETTCTICDLLRSSCLRNSCYRPYNPSSLKVMLGVSFWALQSGVANTPPNTNHCLLCCSKNSENLVTIWISKGDAKYEYKLRFNILIKQTTFVRYCFKNIFFDIYKFFT